MGDPKKTKKKYSKPIHPWRKERIDSDSKLIGEYGLVNRKEVWKMSSFLKNSSNKLKDLIPLTTDQAKKEKEQILKKFQKLGFLGPDAVVGDVLGLSIVNVMERRLQTLVFKKGFARSMKQARQFITHRHVCIGTQKLTVPSYIVSSAEEDMICFSPNSELADPEHPERKLEKAEKTEKEEKGKVEEEKEEGIEEKELEEVEKTIGA